MAIYVNDKKVAGFGGRQGAPGKDGQDGKDGAAAGFGKVTATVDDSTGIPAVEVVATGPDTAKEFYFEFSGLKGEPGKDGEDGTSFTVLGIYDTLQTLQSAHQAGKAGDAWAVGTDDDNEVYIWDVDKQRWESVGKLQGPAGPAGADGKQGEPGVAGEDGAPGKPGADGFSPTVKLKETDDGHEVTITDINGPKVFEVTNGKDATPTPAQMSGIGTISFSASQNVDDTWLRCDGSFVNESDYPELVEALGKLTPGVEDFKELLEAETGEFVSNSCQYGGYVWVYLVKSRKLVGFKGSDRKEITVTGVDDLVELASVDTVLSIDAGAVYLAQAEEKFVLLECDTFTGNESTISMKKLDASSKLLGADPSKAVPRVVDVGGSKYMALGVSTTTSSPYKHNAWYLTWKTGQFGSASKIGITQNYTTSSLTSYVQHLVSAYRAFTPKNSNEMFLAMGQIQTPSTTNSVTFTVFSEVQKLYGSDTVRWFDTITDAIKALTDEPPINIIPIVGSNEYLFRAEITKDRKLKITNGTYNPVSPYDFRTIDITLPSRAVLFKESVCYAGTQGLWFVFVGTGLLFTTNLAEGSWGYLDTQDTLGTIGQFGCVDYDATNNRLWISGVASNGIPKLGMMQLPDLYNYANDGAWLPMIAADGVPAYIKALPDKGT